MNKFIVSLGMSAAMVLAIATTGVVTAQAKGFSIGGFEISNPFASDAKVEAPVVVKPEVVSKGISDLKSYLPSFNYSSNMPAKIVSNLAAKITLPASLKDVRFGNPFDKSTWWDGGDHVNHKPGETMAFNLMDPDFWMSIPNPKTHSQMHGAITNPANWAQFAKPETYAAMRDLNVLSKWFKAETYDVLLDPQTYAYWMQPGAFQHLVNKDHYVQLLNTQAYNTFVDTAVGNFGLTFDAPEDKLSLQGWVNSISKTGSADKSDT